MSAGFVLDPRLAADTVAVAELPLCTLRLMDDARFAWLVLVPRGHGLVEIADLDGPDRTRLWQEVDHAAAALRGTVPCDKINLGALGNIVRQLHVHVVARTTGDPAWPGPVWGSGPALAREPAARDALVARLRQALQEPPR